MAGPAGSLNPEREVTVNWDIDEKFLVEPFFQKRRMGSEIKPSASSNVMLLASGVWILKPVNLDFNALHETSTGAVGQVRLSAANATSQVVEVPMFRNPTELTGIGAGGDVPATGDYFFLKRVTAGASWNSSLTSATTQPTLDTTNYPLDRVLEAPISGALHETNTGYLLRWILPGTKIANPDTISNFYFGGPVLSNGYGQFCLSLSGNGRCQLFESIDGTWQRVADWRFASPQGVMQMAGGLAIIPHYPNFIEFRAFEYLLQTDSALTALVSAATMAARQAAGDGVQTYVHEITNRGANSLIDPTHGVVRAITGPGKIAFDVRRDLRMSWQLHRLVYPASGTLTDRPFTLPGEVAAEHILRIDPVGYRNTLDSGATFVTDITFQMQDASLTPAVNLTTGSEAITFNGTTTTYNGWLPPGDRNEVQVVATFTNSQSGTRYQTPSFLGYEAKREGHTDTISNGVKHGGTLREFTATGPGFNPDEDTGNLKISDLQDELSFVENRGRMGVRIETRYDATSPKTAVLFEGYLGRCDASLRGKTGMVYPSANWRDLSCDLIGKADRMRHAYFHNYEFFFDDRRFAPNGDRSGQVGGPWKVTDAIRHCFHLAGFDDSQLDIFDDPVTLFPSTRGNNQALYVPNLGSSVLDYILMVARDFLNAFVVWDANAGTAGMWRLLRPPNGTETPLWSFTTVPARAGRLQHLSAAYGANTSPILTTEEYKTYVIPPEGNQLTVYGGFNKTPDGKGYHQIRAHISNRASWNAPGFVLSDTGNLDYLGMVVPVAYTDLLIKSQPACNFIARRIFNLACRGRKFVTFGAELVLIQPTDSVYSTHVKRPLRLGDTILIDGTRFLVHSVSPYVDHRKQWNQLMRVEAELYRADVTYGVRP